MKIATLNLTYITLLVAALLLVQPGFAVIDEASLAGLWLFDEGTGKAVEDSSGNGHDGTVIGNPKWVDGKFGKAMEFDGEAGFVDTEYLSDDQNAEYTIMGWIKVNERRAAGHTLVAGRSGGTPQLWVSVKTDKALGQHMMNAGGFFGVEGKTIIPIDKWTHLASTFDGKTIRLYVNGVEENAQDPAAPPRANNFPLQIGAFDETLHGGGYSGNWVPGALDDVALFNATLAAEDIKNIMQKGLHSTVLSVSPADKIAEIWGRIKNRQ